ncbi:hypothetical protein HGRIS_008771 [Hohenbuehelia grisea]|uniref:Uncharacterized protein n=1 Tax=Hohenbuehelia grisea TaxID=104357 RepID=A0ABR3J9J1_9AGAR
MVLRGSPNPYGASAGRDAEEIPTLHIEPNTPPANAIPPSHEPTVTGRDFHEWKSPGHKSPELTRISTSSIGHSREEGDHHVHYPPSASIHTHEANRTDNAPSRATITHPATGEPIPRTQHQILTALAVGAPLIASVVSSCTSVICADLAAALGNEPMDRPAKASAVVGLLWCALVTSLGSTMTAVAGLAMHAGYHDSHVGVTKRIVRFLRRWRDERRAARREERRHVEGQPQDHEHVKHSIHLDVRPPSPVLSAVTDGHRDLHLIASFRAAVVSARPHLISSWASLSPS